MLEQIYFPKHGDKRGGTGYSCYGGFAYGAGLGDPVTLAPDEPTDLFAPSMTTQVEEGSAAAANDRWLQEAGITSTHARRVRASGTQPPRVGLTAQLAPGLVTNGKVNWNKVPWFWIAVGAVAVKALG